MSKRVLGIKDYWDLPSHRRLDIDSTVELYFEKLKEIMIGAQPADKEQRLDINPENFKGFYLKAGMVFSFYFADMVFDKSVNSIKYGLKDVLNLFSFN